MATNSTTRRHTAGTVFADLQLFAQVCIARFIVWRTLRDRRRLAKRNFEELRVIPEATVTSENVNLSDVKIEAAEVWAEDPLRGAF